MMGLGGGANTGGELELVPGGVGAGTGGVGCASTQPQTSSFQ
jgi:hypothetical protein